MMVWRFSLHFRTLLHIVRRRHLCGEYRRDGDGQRGKRLSLQGVAGERPAGEHLRLLHLYADGRPDADGGVRGGRHDAASGPRHQPHTDARSLLPENGGSLLHRAVDSAGSRSRAGHGRHHVRTEAGITPRYTASAKADRTMSCLLFCAGQQKRCAAYGWYLKICQLS